MENKNRYVIKTTAVLMSLIFCISAFCISAGAVNTNDCFLKGDSDSSGYISIMDVTLIQRHLTGLASMSAADLAAADVDGNGIVDINDATELQRYIAEFGNPHQIGEWVTVETQPTTEGFTPGENDLPFIWN